MFAHSMKARLMAIITAGISILLIVSIGSILSLIGKIGEYEYLLEEQVRHEREINAMNLDFKTQVQEWKNVLVRGQDPASLDEYWGRFTQLQRTIQARSNELVGYVESPQVRPIIQQFQRSHAQLGISYTAGFEVFTASGFDHVVGDQSVSGIDREPTRLLQEAADMLSAESERIAAALITSSRSMALSSQAAVVGVAALIILIVWMTIKSSFIRPLQALMGVVHQFADGNFRQHLDTSRTDELGKLTADLANMQREIAQIIGAVQTTSTELNLASENINRAASDIARHTGETESCTDQVAAAVTEMTQTVKEVAGNAHQVAASAEDADLASRSGLQVMDQTIASISALSSEVNKVAHAMDQLEKDTASVGTVLGVIKGIAEQTNLLVLNAAIEAARAGDQGRGFAVVADEVRALARRTQESTAQIQKIIHTVQSGAASAASAMRQGREQSQSTVSLAAETGKSIREITGAISKIKDMVMHIATAAEQQSYATEEINKNVINVVNLVQSSHQSAQYSTDIANTLEGTSTMISGLVKKFKV